MSALISIHFFYCTWEFGARTICVDENENRAEEEEARRAWSAARTPFVADQFAPRGRDFTSSMLWLHWFAPDGEHL